MACQCVSIFPKRNFHIKKKIFRRKSGCLLNILYLRLNCPFVFAPFSFALPLVFISVAVSISPGKTKVSKNNKNQNNLPEALIFVVM